MPIKMVLWDIGHSVDSIADGVAATARLWEISRELTGAPDVAERVEDA
jgi:hypothetical protein